MGWNGEVGDEMGHVRVLCAGLEGRHAVGQQISRETGTGTGESAGEGGEPQFATLPYLICYCRTFTGCLWSHTHQWHNLGHNSDLVIST